jgi:hypothetical protein
MTVALNEVFEAEDVGPPRRRFWICRDPICDSPSSVRGWSFIYDEQDGVGEWQVGWDTWEEWFFEILRYPAEYSSHTLVWRREGAAEIIDLGALQPHYDGKPARADQTPEEAGLR